jgi:8-oxo-dGTP pyrophosphatase MutT (NUDIX family)
MRASWWSFDARAGHGEYRVFPGGGVQSSDRDEVAALRRELAEEIAGVVSVRQPIFSIVRTTGEGELVREIFFLCHLHRFSLSGGPGPEWSHSDPDNRYAVETLDIDEASLRASSLLPGALVEMLIATPDPFDLPSIDV